MRTLRGESLQRLIDVCEQRARDATRIGIQREFRDRAPDDAERPIGMIQALGDRFAPLPGSEKYGTSHTRLKASGRTFRIQSAPDVLAPIKRAGSLPSVRAK